MPESSMNFGNMNFHGGQQSFGNQNTNIQHNHAAPADEVRDLLATIRDEHPDPAFAGRQVTAIEGEIAERTPEARGRVLERLRELAAGAENAQTVVAATTAIGAIVAAGWPF